MKKLLLITESERKAILKLHNLNEDDSKPIVDKPTGDKPTGDKPTEKKSQFSGVIDSIIDKAKKKIADK